MNIFKSKDVKNAFLIGALSTVAYLACYFARNVLSVVSPEIIENTSITVELIGTLSTANMICYAVGQLVNGIIGDKIRGKYLVGGGLVLSGICNVCIGLLHATSIMVIAYSASGFFLSMLYAPLVKQIAENTRPSYAEKCCLGLTFASLLGVPIAGVVAFFFNWENVFLVCGLFLVVMGIVFFFCVSNLEKRGIIKYWTKEKKEKKIGSVKVLVENAIIKFTFVSVLTGIVRTSVAFWIPTYLSQYLGFSVGVAASVYTVMTCIQSVTPYVTNILIYELILKRNMNRMLILMFTLSAVCFLLMFAVHGPLINIVLLILAMMGGNGAANILWTVYCPSLSKTGMVSTATGYLDFMSYLAAGVANQLFANAISQIGWGNLILVWATLMGVGVAVAIPWKQYKFLDKIAIQG